MTYRAASTFVSWNDRKEPQEEMESTSARTTAGMDFYDVFRLDARRWGFFLGHVLTEARTGDGGLLGQDGVVAFLDGERIRGPVSASGIIASIAALLEGLGGGVRDDVAILAMSVPLG